MVKNIYNLVPMNTQQARNEIKSALNKVNLTSYGTSKFNFSVSALEFILEVIENKEKERED